MVRYDQPVKEGPQRPERRQDDKPRGQSLSDHLELIACLELLGNQDTGAIRADYVLEGGEEECEWETGLGISRITS